MMEKKTRILFVCLGNICRSPLAEAIFKHQISTQGLAHLFEAHSCGTANYHVGDSPDPRTIRNAIKNGVHIDHLGRQLSVDDFENYDHLFVMDKNNLKNALRLTNNSAHQSKVSLMRNYDSMGKGEDVPDPYYGTEHDFQEVFDILNRSIEQLIASLRKVSSQQV